MRSALAMVALLTLTSSASASCPTDGQLSHLLEVEGVDPANDVSVLCDEGVTVRVQRGDRVVSRNLDETSDRPGLARLVVLVAAELATDLETPPEQVPPSIEPEAEPEGSLEDPSPIKVGAIEALASMPLGLRGHGANALFALQLPTGLTFAIEAAVTVRRIERSVGDARATHGSASVLAGWSFGDRLMGRAMAGWSLGGTRWAPRNVQAGYRATAGRVAWTGPRARVSLGLPIPFGAVFVSAEALILARKVRVGILDETLTMRGQLTLGVGVAFY